MKKKTIAPCKTMKIHIYGIFNKQTNTVTYITVNEDDFDMELAMLDDDIFQAFESDFLMVF
jgi:hypothetical protein